MTATKWVLLAILIVALLPAGRELLDEMAKELSAAARTLSSR